MKNFFLRFFFLFISSNILQQILSKDYKVYTYDEITENFKDLAINNPLLIKLDNSQSRYNMPFLNCGDTKCEHLIAYFTNFKNYKIDRPIVNKT